MPLYSATFMRGKKEKRQLTFMELPVYTPEKAMTILSSTLAWKIPWTEEPDALRSMGLLRVGTTERLHFHLLLSCIGEGNGNPLQCFCLENPRDGRAWWAAVYGTSVLLQSRTRQKQLSSSSSSSVCLAIYHVLHTHVYVYSSKILRSSLYRGNIGS